MFFACALAGAAAVAVGLIAPDRVLFSARVAYAARLPDPASWVPASANLIVYLDWRALLSSRPMRGLEHDALAAGEQLEEFRELTGMDPWDDLWAIALFTTLEEGKSSWGLAAYGAFDPKRVVETIETRQSVRRTEYRETPLHFVSTGFGGGEESQAFAFPDGSTVLLGPVTQVRAMLDTGFGFTPSAADGELERDLDGLSMAETVWAVGTGQSKLPARLNGNDSSLPDVPLVSFSIAAKFGSDVSITARGETSGEEQARKLAEMVRGIKAMSSLQQQSAAGLPSILGSLEVEALDESVEISLEIEADVFRELMRKEEKKKPD